MKYYLVAEVREDHKSLLKDNKVYNDYVSRKSMLELAEACCRRGYNCEFIGGMEALLKIKNTNSNLEDCIFINYNYGYPSQFKRGQSPILLEMMHAKYSGSDPLTSLLVNDKSFSKKLLNNVVNSPKSILVLSKKDVEKLTEDYLRFPIVIKPNAEGSSLGIDSDSLCFDIESAKLKLLSMLNTYEQILVEEYIEGYEVTVWIIGNKNNYELIQPLVVSTNETYYFEKKIFTLDDKANHIRNYSLPNKILPSVIINKLIETSKIVFEELGMRDYGRIDYRINNNEIFFIEANALPIFSKTSEIGEICNMCQLDYDEICEKMVRTIERRLVSKAN